MCNFWFYLKGVGDRLTVVLARLAEMSCNKFNLSMLAGFSGCYSMRNVLLVSTRSQHVGWARLIQIPDFMPRYDGNDRVEMKKHLIRIVYRFLKLKGFSS